MEICKQFHNIVRCFCRTPRDLSLRKLFCFNDSRIPTSKIFFQYFWQLHNKKQRRSRVSVIVSILPDDRHDAEDCWFLALLLSSCSHSGAAALPFNCHTRPYGDFPADNKHTCPQTRHLVLRRKCGQYGEITSCSFFWNLVLPNRPPPMKNSDCLQPTDAAP